MAKQIYQIDGGTFQVFPAQVVLTGTITSSGTTITGTGTAFLSEFLTPSGYLKYPYLWDESFGELRSIQSVVSDTKLYLNLAFTIGFSNSAINAIPVSNYKWAKIQSIAPYGDAVFLNLVDKATVFDPLFVQGTIPVIIKNKRGIEPFSVQAPGSTGQVMLA